jgi:hypothetical protein
MRWLVSAAKRPSLRRRFFSSRLADLVPIFCSLARSRWLRCRTRFRPLPLWRTPSLVVAMFAIPKSTPINPSGPCTAVSECRRWRTGTTCRRGTPDPTRPCGRRRGWRTAAASSRTGNSPDRHRYGPESARTGTGRRTAARRRAETAPAWTPPWCGASTPAHQGSRPRCSPSAWRTPRQPYAPRGSRAEPTSPSLQPPVGQPLKCVFREHPALVRLPGGDVRGLAAQVQCRPQRRPGGDVGKQTHLHHQLHPITKAADLCHHDGPRHTQGTQRRPQPSRTSL